MPDLYIPGVRQKWAGVYGWSLNGGPAKFILHSTESDSAPGCVDALCAYLDGWANPHVVWDPWTGDMAMCGRADWAGGALLAGNRDGSVVLQVEAVGRAGVVGKRPFVDSPMLGWDKILAWADSWGIPRVFPAGLPAAYPASAGFNNGTRPATVWATRSGYYGHSNVPANDHGDPGLVDLAKIFPGTPGEADPFMTMPAIDANKPLLMTHPDVRTAQGVLAARGAWITPENTNRANLLIAIKWFQGQAKLTADGIMGGATWLAAAHPPGSNAK